MFDKTENYNVIYTSLGKSDRSSMPLGNGEVGLSVFMTEDGTLNFYIARTDAITELDRTVKLGMVKVKFSKQMFTNEDFVQKLILEEGITVNCKNNFLEIFVDCDSPTICVSGKLDGNVDITAEYITWRNEINTPKNFSSKHSKLTESADIVESEDGIFVYHVNGENPISYLAKQQSLLEYIDVIPDKLTGRIFGGKLFSKFGKASGNTICINNSRKFEFVLSTNSSQVGSVNEWKLQIEKIAKGNNDLDVMRTRTANRWKEYFDKSFIFVNGDTERTASISNGLHEYISEPTQCNKFKSKVTAAYILTKFMTKCCANGNAPMFFNGQLFNLMPGNNENLSVNTFFRTFTAAPIGEPTLEINPDERSWCNDHLWQNLRHPYYGMLARGEFDEIKVLFKYYKEFWGINRGRAKAYYNAQGQHNTEVTLSCGIMSDGGYGIDRPADMPLGYCMNRWGASIDISPGLELLKLMLDYYFYTLDQNFLADEVLVYAKDLILYIETRFVERENGKIVLFPLHSLETYFDTKNPTPTVAGMHSVIDDLLKISKLSTQEREYYQTIKLMLPEVACKNIDDKKVLDVAEWSNGKVMNVEVPELYAIYPFRLFENERISNKVLVDTFYSSMEESANMRPFTIGETPGMTSYSGWQYAGPVAAMLGQKEKCREILEENSALTNPGNRFLAMWGPIYDAVPDTDHGANIINTLQLMAFRIEFTGENTSKIHINSAMPKDWNVWFKFYAPQNTSVEILYNNGVIEKCEVCPKSREKDIVVHY